MGAKPRGSRREGSRGEGSMVRSRVGGKNAKGRMAAATDGRFPIPQMLPFIRLRLSDASCECASLQVTQ